MDGVVRQGDRFTVQRIEDAIVSGPLIDEARSAAAEGWWARFPLTSACAVSGSAFVRACFRRADGRPDH
jgi:hypothetical protein